MTKITVLSVILVSMTLGCSTTGHRRVGLFDRFLTDQNQASSSSSSDKNIYHVNKYDQSIETTETSPQSLKRLKELAQGWAWPLKSNEITSQFGQRTREFHEGIDLKASSGTSIFAVDDGVVVYSGSRISGYGKMLIIKHAAELSSVYAHASKILVKRGAKIKKGELIAYSGATGKVSGAHLHFEVRQGVMAVDPEQVMPGRQVASVATSVKAPRMYHRKKMRSSLATIAKSQ